MALLNVMLNSEIIGSETPISIVYPENNKSKKDLRFMFLLHGSHGGHLDFIRNTNIERLALDKNIVLIMPFVGNSFYTNMDKGINYFDYLTIELFNFIQDMFNLEMTNENTYIAGISMGGYGALKYAFKYPKRFKHVYALSSLVSVSYIFNNSLSDNIDNMAIATFGNLDNQEKEELLYNINSQDINLGISLLIGKDDYLLDDNINFSKLLDTNNIKHEFIINEGSHNWDYWNYNLIEIINKL